MVCVRVCGGDGVCVCVCVLLVNMKWRKYHFGQECHNGGVIVPDPGKGVCRTL